jgi:hypothetical protein
VPPDIVERHLALAEPADAGGEVQLDACQQLPEFIVQLASDARPLRFAHLLEMRSKGAQLLRGMGVHVHAIACSF